MIPARLDFPCRTNADYTEELALVDGSVPVDLTGYSLSMTARLTVTGTSVFALSTVTTDIQGFRLVDAAGGIIELRINWETLNTAYNDVVDSAEQGNPINLVYDIKIAAPDTDEDVWFVGFITIEKGVTDG